MKCEYIVSSTRQRRIKPQYQSRAALLNAISGPISVAPFNEAIPGPDLTTGQVEKLQLSQRISRDPSSSDDTTHTLPKDEPEGEPNGSSSNAQYGTVLHSSPVVETPPSPQVPHSLPIRSRPTIEFRIPTSTTARRRLTTIAGIATSFIIYSSESVTDCDGIIESVPYSGRPLVVSRSPSISRGAHARLSSSKFSNFGGFPGPLDILRHMFPRAYRTFKRKFTLPHTTTFVSSSFGGARHDTIRTPWLPFDGLVVRRNSFFHTDSLTAEQLEAIGGVEYRALRFLSYFVIFVSFGAYFKTFILLLT